MVFVSGGRFVNRAPGERNVIVYTNCDEVTLILNGAAVETKKAEDHMITFENVALLDGDNTVTAVSGDVKGNEIRLCGVAEHDYSYDLPDGNQGVNWFDDPEAVAMKKAFKYPKDAYSIKDKMGDLMANPQANALLGQMMAAMAGGGGAGSAMMSSMGQMSEEMMGFMRMMRLSDALKMAGDAVSMETKLKINMALNQIKK
jgi:beta-galactosidase